MLHLLDKASQPNFSSNFPVFSIPIRCRTVAYRLYLIFVFILIFVFSTPSRNRISPSRFWRSDRHLVCMTYILGEWRVTIPLPLVPQTSALPIELHPPSTPLHQINGLAAIWEWGFPVIRTPWNLPVTIRALWIFSPVLSPD